MSQIPPTSSWSSSPEGTSFQYACNYAPESENAIHQDQFAKQYNFAGGLVPGVGIYCLMADPFARIVGIDWFDGGWLHAKFIRPVYDGEKMEVVCEPKDPDTLHYPVRVLNPRGELCAIGSGGHRSDDCKPPDPLKYPRKTRPDPENRLKPEASSLPAGYVLGSVPVVANPDIQEDRFFEALRENLPLCMEAPGRFHPGLLPHLANRMVHRNIAVGPWIHTESRVTHFGPVRPRGGLELRGIIQNSYPKRGHEYVELDLAVFDEEDEPLAHLVHVAIVSPRLDRSPGSS